MEGRSDGCHPETGSGAVPRSQQRPTARIHDAMIRCGDHPSVALDIVSPSELRAWRARDRRRQHLQDVEGVQEIVGIDQDEAAIHVYRRGTDGDWRFSVVHGLDAAPPLARVGLAIPVAEIYQWVALPV